MQLEKQQKEAQERRRKEKLVSIPRTFGHDDYVTMLSNQDILTQCESFLLSLSLEARGVGGLVMSAGYLTVDCPKLLLQEQ
jgi:hypothetical protein